MPEKARSLPTVQERAEGTEDLGQEHMEGLDSFNLLNTTLRVILNCPHCIDAETMTVFFNRRSAGIFVPVCKTVNRPDV